MLAKLQLGSSHLSVAAEKRLCRRNDETLPQFTKHLHFWYSTTRSFHDTTGLRVDIGAYQGALNSLSSISLFHTCVVPTLFYGSENWILTEQTIARHRPTTFRTPAWPCVMGMTSALSNSANGLRATLPMTVYN